MTFRFGLMVAPIPLEKLLLLWVNNWVSKWASPWLRTMAMVWQWQDCETDCW